MSFERLLTPLLTGKPLSYRAALSAFRALFSGQYTEAQAKALVLLMASRGENAAEVRACADALQSLEKGASAPFPDLIDTCGTGGDGKHSINVSTLAAFVVAGAGGRVAKHGNRAISSRTGSSDLMEALGVRLDAGPAAMRQALKKARIGYFHAPLYHPVFARVQPLRKALGVRTIFNLLGPLVNPCRLAYQLTGVSRAEHLELYAEVIRQRGTIRRALVCHSEDGMDEISLNSPTRYAWIESRKIRRGVIEPRKLGFKRVSEKHFRGGSAAENARFARNFLQGKVRDARADLICLNAAAALWVAGLSGDLSGGLDLAKNSVKSGRAFDCLQRLIRITRKKG